MIEIKQNDKIIYTMKSALFWTIFSIGVFVGFGMGLLSAVIN